MRKVLALILSLTIALALVGCVDSSNGEIQSGQVDTDLSDNASVSDDTNSNDEDLTDASTTEQVVEKLEVAIEETVLVDESGIKITAKSLDLNGFLGPEVKLLIENNSGQDLTFQCRNSSVNGYMAEPMMSVDVSNGKKANDSLVFTNSDLESCGIETIADMEFSFHIFSTESWDTYLDTPLIKLKTSAADTYTYAFDDSGSVAYEANGIKIVVKGLSDNDSFLGPSIIVYIENTSNNNITVQARKVSVNGFMIDPIFSSDVVAGKRAIDSITFMTSDLEDNDISVIETVELSFHIFDIESWDTIVDTEIISITF